ncbi:hypothetical protein ARMGADRAFT_692304 [Armillaria gallica]|uniref:Uncharacterized protein n=1 Tax=Armillaria gallica TaxID=47427 RepID=A0A2H3E6Y7_ARMGA|nr:hypothetical protein ARMGADRAFT_692304 [Armillaria gallica]
MMNFVRSGKCWSRLVEIDGQKHARTLALHRQAGPLTSLPASPKMARRIRKDVDDSAAFDRLWLTLATYLGAHFYVMPTW